MTKPQLFAKVAQRIAALALLVVAVGFTLSFISNHGFAGLIAGAVVVGLTLLAF